MAEKGLHAIGEVTGRHVDRAWHCKPRAQRSNALHGIVDNPEDLRRFMEIYGARLTKLTRPYPGVVQTLGMLQAQGWHMGVCTNKREAFARTIVSNLGLDKYFKCVSGPDTFGASKPNPLQLAETAVAVGGPNPVLFVGDSEVDVAAGKAALYPSLRSVTDIPKCRWPAFRQMH